MLVSELAGRSNILWKAQEYGIDLDKDTPETRRILETLKTLEDEGYQFEGAEASFELLMERALGRHRPYFELEAYRVTVEARQGDQEQQGGKKRQGGSSHRGLYQGRPGVALNSPAARRSVTVARFHS